MDTFHFTSARLSTPYEEPLCQPTSDHPVFQCYSILCQPTSDHPVRLTGLTYLPPHIFSMLFNPVSTHISPPRVSVLFKANRDSAFCTARRVTHSHFGAYLSGGPHVSHDEQSLEELAAQLPPACRRQHVHRQHQVVQRPLRLHAARTQYTYSTVHSQFTRYREYTHCT